MRAPVASVIEPPPVTVTSALNVREPEASSANMLLPADETGLSTMIGAPAAVVRTRRPEVRSSDAPVLSTVKPAASVTRPSALAPLIALLAAVMLPATPSAVVCTCANVGAPDNVDAVVGMVSDDP